MGARVTWECEGFDWSQVQPWQLENVKPCLTGSTTPRDVIRDAVIAFVGDDPEPDFYAYVDCYDWVAFMQLFGAMMNKPEAWPHSSKDIKELMLSAGLTKASLPVQKGTLHRADYDAEWDMAALKFILDHLARKEAQQARDFPRYQMYIGDCDQPEAHWLPIGKAGVAYDSGFIWASIGGRVMERDGTERAITDAERAKIVDIADEYSGSK